MSTVYRQRVVRADGRVIDVVQRRAHLSYCFTGCCCGRTERGYAPVPADTFKEEWLRRKLRSVVHLTKAGCLGPCELANVASLVFDGRAVWFHSVNTPWHVRVIFDYIETMVRADRYVAPPSQLTEYVFNYYDWDARPTVSAPAIRTKLRARPLFIGGTSSNAGKSWMATAICAWLRGKGMSVAPFKAQNMSNNSYPCKTGGEIGRAQVAQAEACGLEPEPSMNPILLKPNGNGTSQVVVNGRVWKTLSAREYYAHAAELRGKVMAAYEELARRFDAVVIEGAGSVTELNLREHDLVNLGLVTRIRAPWLLVADIERGGVFGAVVGTAHLLSADERSLFRGFAINKFRGDMSLFDDGVRILEERAASTCVGVFPYASDLHLDAEDSLALQTRPCTRPPPGARLAIVQFPHVSNSTDFRLLTWAEWITAPGADRYDFIILPGSKNTIADLAWLRGCGLADWILQQHRSGAIVIGICGGYQMLGRTVHDPAGMESSARSAEGLGLLPAVTSLTPDKQTRAVAATTPGGAQFGGYEIHLGVTTLDRSDDFMPFAWLGDDGVDGVRRPGVIGTYLHGAFEHPAVCAEVFGIDAPSATAKSVHYERLAAWFEQHVRHLDQLGLG